MTVELSDNEARELADILLANEEALIAEFATTPVDIDDTESGKWASTLRRRIGATDEDGIDRIEPDWERIVGMARLCESYADGIFGDTMRFTGLTVWRDGDFRIEVRHGQGDYGNDPYRCRHETVSYREEDGNVIYADFTRFIDHRFKEVHEQRVVDADPEPLEQ